VNERAMIVHIPSKTRTDRSQPRMARVLQGVEVAISWP